MSQQTQSLKIQALKVSLEFSDAHCHLPLFSKPAETIANARNEGVGLIITSGGNAKDNLESIKIANGAQGVFATIGIGPDSASSESDFVEGMADLVRSSRKVIGIGEIGIDVKAAGHAGLEIQRKVFGEQLDIAVELDLPVVIHSRGALDEISAMLEKKGVRSAVFHFFEGDERQAKALAGRGYLISIPPVETGRRKRVIKSISVNSIVAETDSPVVGRDPTDVVKVCKTIAALKGISIEDVASATTENIRRLFYI
jgi:TatD DNase family protein